MGFLQLEVYGHNKGDTVLSEGQHPYQNDRRRHHGFHPVSRQYVSVKAGDSFGHFVLRKESRLCQISFRGGRFPGQLFQWQWNLLLQECLDGISENILSYSPNGAIEKLQRYGKRNNDTFGLIDDLTYQYNGNQIKAISDKAGSLLYDGSFDFKDGANEATEYFYDANGALTKDLNKGIGNIEYDVLGNPQCITFANGNKTKYVYDADGSKLRTTHESVVTNTIDYAGKFVFEDGKLDKYLFEGGYCSFDANLQPTYHYYEKDHLGSVRMVVNENGAIEQVNHYYPFGGVYGDLSYNSELQRNKYIGKELDHTDGLDWYDHGARMYDAAKVSWDRMEPLYDKYYHLNPYSYCEDNPLINKDLDGKRGRSVYFSDSKPPQYYRSSWAFHKAMTIFAKTDFGKKILSDFTPKGSYFYGVKGNGKYASYDLLIQENSIANPQERTAFFLNLNAQTSMKKGVDGKPKFLIIFDVQRTVEELVETIAHEFAGHLYKYQKIIDTYERTKDYEKAKSEYDMNSMEEEHKQMENPKLKDENVYQQVIKQLEMLMHSY